MSLFSTLNIANSALSASQIAIDVTSQNIANADVDSYSRKRVNTTAKYRYDAIYGQMGTGVDVTNIERLTNKFASSQILAQNEQVGYYTQTNSTYESIEGIFSESSDSGLQSYIDDFFDSWDDLANDPSDTSARTSLQTSAQILTDAFNSTSGELTDLKNSLNTSISDDVDKINELTGEISALNKEIANVEISGQNANDSRDKRDELLTELSGYINIDTTENSLGEITVTSGGSILVSPEASQDLKVATTTYTAADGSTVTDTGIKFADSNLTYTPSSGELKGILDSRDTIIPEYQDKLDTLANSVVSQVNAVHEQGYSLDGVTGIDFFDPSSTGASDMSLSAAVLSSVDNIAASGSGKINTAPTETLTLTYGTAQNLANSDVCKGSVVVKAGDTTLTENVDYQIDYSTGAIQMLHSGYDGTALTINYNYNTGGSSGTGDNTNALAISALRNTMTMDKNSLGNATSTFTDNYSSMISNMGLDASYASANLDSRTTLLSQYKDAESSVSGVNMDEEASNLIVYQNAYSAAARIVTTTSDMLDVLMAM